MTRAPPSIPSTLSWTSERRRYERRREAFFIIFFFYYIYVLLRRICYVTYFLITFCVAGRIHLFCHPCVCFHRIAVSIWPHSARCCCVSSTYCAASRQTSLALPSHSLQSSPRLRRQIWRPYWR
jgi:hypothetical protein